jgi:hypothetical protein
VAPALRLVVEVHTAGATDEHRYAEPDLFTAESPCGSYQGMTDQVVLSRIPAQVPLSFLIYGEILALVAADAAHQLSLEVHPAAEGIGSPTYENARF